MQLGRRTTRLITTILALSFLFTGLLPEPAKSQLGTVNAKALPSSAAAAIATDGKALTVSFGVEVYYNGTGGDGPSKRHVITIGATYVEDGQVQIGISSERISHKVFRMSTLTPATPDTPDGDKISPTLRSEFGDKYFLAVSTKDKVVAIVEKKSSFYEALVDPRRSSLQGATIGEAFIQAYSFDDLGGGFGPHKDYKMIVGAAGGNVTEYSQAKAWADCLSDKYNNRIKIGIRDFLNHPEFAPIAAIPANPACNFPGLTALLVAYETFSDGKSGGRTTLDSFEEAIETVKLTAAGAAIGTVIPIPGVGTGIGAISGFFIDYMGKAGSDVASVRADKSDNVIFYFISLVEEVPLLIGLDAVGDGILFYQDKAADKAVKLEGEINSEEVKADSQAFLNHITNRVFMGANMSNEPSPWCTQAVPHPKTATPAYGPEKPESYNSPGKGRVGCLYTEPDGWLAYWGVKDISSNSGDCGITDIVLGDIGESSKRLTECLVDRILRPMIEWATDLVQTAAGISYWREERYPSKLLSQKIDNWPPPERLNG